MIIQVCKNQHGTQIELTEESINRMNPLIRFNTGVPETLTCCHPAVGGVTTTTQLFCWKNNKTFSLQCVKSEVIKCIPLLVFKHTVLMTQMNQQGIYYLTFAIL